ncbi:hypothetical protein MNV49_004935 [Pseudohyphozyma bogoriensis]|nr:hypothetical protein MNV49_004935 [Pseudohyphozyma bogoriensis]
MSTSRHARRASTSEKDEETTLLASALPSPVHPRSTHRAIASGIIILFAVTILWFAVVEPEADVDVDDSTMSGLGWRWMQSVSWGRNKTAASVSLKEEEEEEYVVSKVSLLPVANSTTSHHTSTSTSAAHRPTTLVKTSGFNATTSTHVSKLLSSGNLKSYVWHSQFPSSSWNTSSSGRLLVVGDVHGSYTPLTSLLDRLSFSAHDTLVHAGDLVAKSPLNATLQVVALMREMGAKGVRGNHDQGAIEWRAWMEAYGPLVSTVNAQTKPTKGVSAVKGDLEAALAQRPSRPARPPTKGKGVKGAGAKGATNAKGRPKQKPGKGKAKDPVWIESSAVSAAPAAATTSEDREMMRDRGSHKLGAVSKEKRGWFGWGSTSTANKGELEGAGTDSTVLDGGIREQEPLDDALLDDYTEDYELDVESTGTTSTARSSTSTAAKAKTTSALNATLTHSNASTALHTGFAIGSTHALPSSMRPSHNVSSATSSKDAAHGVVHSTLSSKGALVGDGWEWLELSKSEAKALGVVIPKGWEWGGEWFEIARHLPSEDAKYLRELPLTLWVEELGSYIVHAGLMPWDTDDLPESDQPTELPSTLKSTSMTTFVPSESVSDLFTSVASSLLVVPENTMPFTLLNTRALKQSGDEWVPTKGKKGTPWWKHYNDRMKDCETEKVCKENGVGVIYGHWAAAGLTIAKQTLGLDSACAVGNRLSMALFSPSSPKGVKPSSPLSTTAASTGVGAYRKLWDTPSKTSKGTALDKAFSRPSSAGKLRGPRGPRRMEKRARKADKVDVETEKEAELEDIEDEKDIEKQMEEAKEGDGEFEEESVTWRGTKMWIVSVACGSGV